jgi:hypothetical protein
MTEVQRVVLLVAVVGVLLLTAGVGTVAADAPDCSAVSYNGDGTESNPYEVSNVDQLQCIEEQGLDANYVQVSDIDASGTPSWNGGKGFEPIGEFNRTRDTEFTGTFDGADHTISGLYIERRSTFNVGLFGGVGRDARLKNIGVENVNINADLRVGALIGINGGPEGGSVTESYATGSVSGTSEVSGLVGRNNGDITESYATVDVTARFGYMVGGLVGLNGANVTESYATGSVSGSKEVGGLVGNNIEGTVRKSYATGSVSGGNLTGGLVGNNNRDSTVRKSYATGSVSGNDFVGGLVGSNVGFAGSSTVTESYATGSVSGNDEVGGLVGENFGGTVRESYATGDVSGNDEVGGLVGTSTGATVRKSYWDVQSSGQSTSARGTGLTTSEMTGSAATSNMAGFDFTDTWKTVTSPDDYPILAWQTQTAPSPPNFEVSIDSTNSPVTEGDTLTVTATVTNTGGQQDTQTITASASGLGSITRPVTLNGGESTTETVSIPTSPGDAGTFTITVETADDTATTTVTINPAGGGALSPNNPFGDSSNNPVDRSTVIDRVVEWNLNGEINGTSFTRQEIINFVVGWNLA